MDLKKRNRNSQSSNGPIVGAYLTKRTVEHCSGKDKIIQEGKAFKICRRITDTGNRRLREAIAFVIYGVDYLTVADLLDG